MKITVAFQHLRWNFHSLFLRFQAPILAEIRREVSELKRKDAEAEAVATDKIPGGINIITIQSRAALSIKPFKMNNDPCLNS